MREVALGAYAHQELPFEKLVEELRPERTLSFHPLFQAMFNFRSFPRSAPEIPGLRVEDVEVERRTSLVDLSMNVTGTSNGFACRIFYNARLFDAATIERLATHYQMLLAGVADNPGQRLSRLRLLTDEERHQLLIEWNDTAVDHATDRCIHQLFEEQVERAPEAVAVAFQGERLTYRELNHRANQLGTALAERGVGAGSYVPILMDRGVEVVVAMLAVMKAGAAFVPLDLQWPAERIRSALEELNGGVVLVDRAASAGEALRGRSVLLVDGRAGPCPTANLDLPASPADPIYAI